MDVKINKLYEIFLHAKEVGFDYGLTFSLRRSPKLKEFLDDLDPELVLDAAEKSFYGMPELRQRVVESQGYNVTADNLLITAGTNEANFLTLTQTVSPGDEIVMDMPSWPQIYELATAYGAKVKVVKRRAELGWGLDLEELRQAVTPRTRLIFVNAPNNPTGAVCSEDEMKQICAIAAENDAYLLSDEVYRGLEWEGPLSPAAVNYYEKAISASSVSKTLGLQGLRTGWMATRDKDLLYKCLVLREDTSEVMNVLGEHIALAALQPGKYNQLLQEGKDDGRRCWSIVADWIDNSEVFDWVQPRAGFLGFVKYNLDIKSEDFCLRLLERPYRTLVLPGTAFDFENYIRLGVGGGNDEEIRKGLEQLDQFVKDLQG